MLTMDNGYTRKLFIIPIISLLALLAVTVFAFSNGNNFAYAEKSPLTLTEVTSVDSGNVTVPFNYALGEYGRDVEFDFQTTASYYSFVIYKKSSGVYTKIQEEYGKETDGEFTVIPSQSGVLKLEVSAETEFGVAISTLTYEFKSDNVAPFEPILTSSAAADDMAECEFNNYHVAPFNFSYKLNYDNDSGMDFTKSYYKIEDLDGVIITADTLISSGYGKKQIMIEGNCKVIFCLYDCAGNSSTFSYSYTKHGVPESGVPTITVTPSEGYTKSANVSISWGEGYDDNPYGRKYYAIKSPELTPIKTAYVGAFDIKTENATVIVYYYEGGTEKTVIRDVTNIDATSPSATMLEESFNVSIDLTKSDCITVSLRALDYGSGIAKVYDNYGNVYSAGENGYYTFSLKDLHTFSVIAEDNVGNKASYGYSNPTLDYATMKEIYAAFDLLSKAAYCESGWNAVLSSVSSLSLYLLDDTATTSKIAELKRAVYAAAEGAITVTTRFSSVPSGLTEFVIKSGIENTDVLFGDTARFVIGKIIKLDSLVSANKTTATAASGFTNATAYGFTAELQKNDGSGVALGGNIVFGFKVNSPFTDAKVYRLNSDGTLVEVSSLINSDGEISVYTAELGEFYVVTELSTTVSDEAGFTVNGVFYSWKVIVITVAVIVAAGGIVFAAVYFITKFKRSQR